jgi:DNA modification methylase
MKNFEKWWSEEGSAMLPTKDEDTEEFVKRIATFPPALIKPCILAGSRESDIVLDPFMGSGTTAQVALQHNRKYLGCELNQSYASLQQKRIGSATTLFNQ